MRKWIVACIAGSALVFATSGAMATKKMGDEVGVKACKTCHEGSPKDKKFNEKLTKHFDCAKKAAKTCKSCHDGKPKGKEKCK